MKKLLCAALIATLVLSVGCKRVGNEDVQDTNPDLTEENETLPPQDETTTADKMYEDGVYRAEMDDKAAELNNGWKDYVEVTITNGEISDIDLDATSTENKLRSEDTTYTMEPTLRDWIDNLVNRITTNNDINDMDELDTVKGSENYKKLVSVALENAKTGNKEVAVVSTDEMK